MDENASLYSVVPGGPELLAWFERTPSFHDAEIVSLELRRRSESVLRVHAWRMTSAVDERGYFVLDKHAVVSFVMEDILDLELGHFSHQNVIYGLTLKRPSERPERQPFNIAPLTADDFEIELDDCYGMGGFIACRKLSILFAPGKPDDV